ncbi:ent-kaurene synthase-like 3 [Oryza sativa Japonica Group]|uniref:ent-kaurene synthase-like 3 n=1 Tax=Oryza sativa subsp. japonica TaxID=39947 RepID=UPI000E1BB184|nr:ent-kaurene synthase-like 3 [Oryza sativa Japonica Group]
MFQLELVNVVMHQRKAIEDTMRKKKKQQLHKFEMLPSPYDTAWVAMVPLPGSSSQLPCFPQCVEWILQNQQSNGSWDLNQLDSITKDALLSTLACVLALRRGLLFIGRNFSIAMDEQLAAPIGFNITFPGMLSSVIEMGLEVPIGQTDVERVLHLQETELKREYEENYRGRNTYMAYVSEGLGNAQDWNEVMNFQRKNGSLFNSLSITAAVLVHNYDAKAHRYLNLLLNKFGTAVYTKNIHRQLSMLDALENMGISRHFDGEIKSILDMTYSCWLQRDEEVMLDITTCAMAFRILRMNGYDVSSDDLCHIAEVSDFHSSHQGYLSDTRTLLELYKASEVSVADNEFILDRIGSWSGRLLKEQLSSGALQRTSSIFEEVEHALDCPFYATLDRLVHKRNIEHFAAMSIYHMLKTTYLPCQTAQDLVALGARNFSTTQSIYQDELERIDSWVKENRLHELKFARQKSAYFYLSAAGTVFDPEMSDARIWWAINGVLTTVVDDFFDVGGSREELENLISLVEMWDEHHKEELYSEQVEIVFFAIFNSVNQLGAKVSAVQGRDVTKHLIEIWLDLLRSMMTEVEWRISNYVPTPEEYMENAAMTFALGPIVLPALYLVGPKIPESVVRDSEYNELFRLMSTCGRLLNDVQTYEREDGEGKVNSVSLLVIQSGGSVSIEEARREIMKPIERCRRELLGLVLRRGSAVPGPCKELFWKMCKVCYFFYSRGDGFSSPTAKSAAVDAVIRDPLDLAAVVASQEPIYIIPAS